MANPKCKIDRVTLGRGVQAVILSTPLLTVTVLQDKGADIYSLVHNATGIDVLWKSPLGVRGLNQGRLAPDSATAWLEVYEGGWQEILPNGGDACQYNGVELSYHGETTLLPWNFEIIEQLDDSIVVEFSVQLYRSPFHVRRRMSLNAASPCVRLSETVTNLAAGWMDLMWGHHPAYGAPFLSGETRLETSAQTILVDDSYDPPLNALQPGASGMWPMVAQKSGGVRDLSRLPGETERCDHLAYLLDFGEHAWYALTNPQLNLGVGMAWSPDVFKCLWLWQEVHGSTGFPFYGQAYTVAVEPWSSYPGFGLAKVQQTTKTHLTLAAGAQVSSELVVTLFEPAAPKRVKRITLDGTVIQEN